MNPYGKNLKIKLLKLLEKLNKTITEAKSLARIIAVKIYGRHLVRYLITTKLNTTKSVILSYATRK